MSQNHGGRRVHHPTPDKARRPSLERPSLFAGMDGEASTFDDGDMQRVRILSTLESARRPARKGPMKIQGVTRKKRGAWQARVLIGLMGMGVATLLASFVMVLLDGHSESAVKREGTASSSDGRTATSSNAVTPSALPDHQNDNPLAALIAPPQHTAHSPSPEQAAVIENVISTAPPTAAGVPATHERVATIAPSRALSPATSPTTSPAPATPPPTVAKPSPVKVASAAPAARRPMATTAATAADTKTVDTLKTAASKPPARRPAHGDEDVALLEAMFAHTRPRPAAPAYASVGEELKMRCGSLSGADAATCRARLCVQHPTASACHQE